MTKMVPPDKTTMSSTGSLLRIFIYCFFNSYCWVWCKRYMYIYILYIYIYIYLYIYIYIYELVLQKYIDIMIIIIIFNTWRVKDYKERNNFILSTTFGNVSFPCQNVFEKCTTKTDFVMVKAISKSYTLNCSCKCPCTFPHSYT